MQLGSTLSLLQTAITQLQQVDVLSLAGNDATALLDSLTVELRRLSALRDSFATRAVAANQHNVQGARSSASWLAARTGISEKDARQTLSLQNQLVVHPEVEEAITTGTLSLEKAMVVVRAARGSDSVCQELLSHAKSDTVEALQQRSRAIAQRGQDTDGRHRRLRLSQYLTITRDEDNMVLGQFKLLPEIAAPFLTKYEHTERKALTENSKATEPLPMGVARAEAFGKFLTESGGTTSSAVTYHVDLEAFDRGYTQDNERCEIAGVGPVPVSVIKELAGHPIAKVVLTAKNKLVGFFETPSLHRNKPLPEYIKRAIKAASYDQCVTPGCISRARDIDHTIAKDNGGDHTITNLKPLCEPCHAAKTKRDVPWTITKFYASRPSPRPRPPLMDTG